MTARSLAGTEILNLCFHGIGVPDRSLEPGEDQLWVTETQFDDLLDVIARYPSVRITFDDGNSSDAATALPALSKRNLPLPSSSLLTVSTSRGRYPLLGSGIWPRAECGWVHTECRIGTGARSMIPNFDRNWLTRPASLRLPPGNQYARSPALGDYNRRVLTAVRRYGYERVYTVDGGAARKDAWLQDRYTVLAVHTPADIERRARFPRGGRIESAVRAGKSMVKRWR